MTQIYDCTDHVDLDYFFHQTTCKKHYKYFLTSHLFFSHVVCLLNILRPFLDNTMVEKGSKK